MNAFPPLPLGRRIPDRSHAVSCSLPTMRDVIGYEEKDPEITRHLSSGYPRFVVHPFSREAAAWIARERGLAGQSLWLTSSAVLAESLRQHLAAPEAQVFSCEGVSGVAFPETAELASRAKVFLQHVGGFVSSRQAEDFLVRVGARPTAEKETLFAGDAASEVRRVLTPAFAPVAAEELLLANSGMNAFYAAFRAVQSVQAARGRDLWLQLGWLYLDTIAILQKFSGGAGNYLHLPDVFDLSALRNVVKKVGHRLAGVVTEAPTNPLVQTPALAELAALAREHGARVVLDPTLASPLNIDVLPHADVVVNSLTKYAGSEGDVLAGVIAVNPASPDAAALRAAAAARLEPVYPRDLARLAAQIGDYPAVIARINQTAPRVVDWLTRHPQVAEVHWSLHPRSRENYRRIARHPDAAGGMISFRVRPPLERFYDRLRLPKGPSFGMKTTLVCPFMYLAHYDLVTSAEGRKKLAENGLSPDLLRMSLGTEPAEEILAALDEALRAAAQAE